VKRRRRSSTLTAANTNGVASGAGVHTFDRRALVLSGLGGLFFAALGARMAQLQIFENTEFRLQAAENQFNLLVNPASRGPIYDRFGVPLAVNRRDFRVMMMREDVKDLDGTIKALASILQIPADKALEIRKDALSSPRFMPSLVAEKLSWEQYSAMNIYATSYPGVRVEMGEARNYPLGESTAHILGYVAKANAEDVKKDPEARHPGVRVGKEGIEKSQELGIKGKHGATKLEVTAHGRVLREVVDPRLNPVAGQPIVLTIDAELQQIAHDQFAPTKDQPAESGSAVVIDVRTGELLVMVSTPGFDPNKFVDGIARADFTEYNTNERRPLYHKTVRGIYPPGSTYKMVTAIAALEHGVTTPEETVFCPGHYTLGGNRFHCHARRGHGHVNVHDALKVSCDVYFYEMGRRLGGDKMAEISRGMGFGQKFDIGIPGVARAHVPDTQWKLENRKQPWAVYDSINVSIGQGLMVATPLQLAVMTARLASRKLAIEPRLIREGPGSQMGKTFAALPFKPETMERVHQGMIAVSNEAGGTARADIGIEGVIIAGKTGTSQVRRITMAERRAGVRSNASLPWNRRDHALFVSYAPADDPKYACVVVVEHGGGGSKAAAPRAREILKATLLKDPSARPAFSTKVQTASTAMPARAEAPPDLPPQPKKSPA
jgi:penicillin-binding protein 2